MSHYEACWCGHSEQAHRTKLPCSECPNPPSAHPYEPGSALLAQRDALMSAGKAFTEHHDNGQTGQPGFPWTYGDLDIWQAEWDRRYERLRAILAEQREVTDAPTGD